MVPSLPLNWLDRACSHAATGWLKMELKALLPGLVAGALSPQDFADRVSMSLVDRKLSSPAQQKNPRSNVVQALKAIDPNHPAISLVGLSTEQYRDLNEEQRGRLADRETKFITSADADVLVERATALLESAEWADVAAGLAVLLGRRISEILLSEFSLKSPWSLDFSEMSKKPKLATGLSIEIPTLAPAQRVLSAIERLQAGLKIDDLKGRSLTAKGAKQTVNLRYSEFVTKACHQHFADIVPGRANGENLYTHIFRALYASIAAHWFCPVSVPEYNFKAEIQGHFTISQDGRKLPNYSARANYDDYAISTQDGNRDGRLGIKLGRLPGLQVIEVFRKDAPVRAEPADVEVPAAAIEDFHNSPILETEDVPMTRATRTKKQPQKGSAKTEEAEARKVYKRPELLPEDLERMSAVMAQRRITGSYAEVFHALLEAFEQLQGEHQQQEKQETIQGLETIKWFTSEIDALRKTIKDLEQERDALKANQIQSQEMEEVRAENARLMAELHDTRSRLHGIEQLLGGRTGQSSNGTPVSESLAPMQPQAGHERTAPAAAAHAITSQSHSAIAPQHTEPKPEVTRRNRSETTDKINQIVDALIAWNTGQEHMDTQLRISIPTVKGLASAMGANYQSAIQQVLKERQSELDELHSRFMLGTRHNATVSSKDEVIRAIAQDYLGLENWQEVKYTG